MPSSAILLAAGSGRRMHGTVDDKILAPLNGRPAFLYSVDVFVESGIVDHLTLVYRDTTQREALQTALKSVDLGGVSVNWVEGGRERQDSVYNALCAQATDCAYVFIHDCARPLITKDTLERLAEAVRQDQAACLAHPVIDTIKRIPDPDQLRSTLLEDMDRSRLWAMETPQAFDYSQIRAAYEHVRASKLVITDDTAAAATIGLQTTLVPNKKPNPKLTTPADLAYIQHLLNECRMADAE